MVTDLFIFYTLVCICYKKELQLFTGAAGVEHVQGYATPAHAHAGCAGLLRSGD